MIMVKNAEIILNRYSIATNIVMPHSKSCSSFSSCSCSCSYNLYTASMVPCRPFLSAVFVVLPVDSCHSRECRCSVMLSWHLEGGRGPLFGFFFPFLDFLQLSVSAQAVSVFNQPKAGHVLWLLSNVELLPKLFRPPLSEFLDLHLAVVPVVPYGSL